MSGGFTLIEMIAVIIVVSILAAVAVPSLANLGSSRASAAANQLLSDVTYARERALATGRPTWVVFDLANERWTIKQENSASPGRAGATVLNDPVDGRPFIVTINSEEFVGAQLLTASFDGDPEVGFDWLGRPLSTDEVALPSNGTVTMTANYTLTVQAGSGHITLATSGGGGGGS